MRQCPVEKGLVAPLELREGDLEHVIDAAVRAFLRRRHAGRQHRRQRQRDEKRDDHRSGNRQPELAEKAPDNALHEDDGQEDRRD